MKLIPLALSITLLTGCVAPKHKIYQKAFKNTKGEVTFIDDDLYHHIGIVGAGMIPLKNGLPKVHVDINNTTNERYEFQYKILWYDNKGYEVGTTRWKPEWIYAKTIKQIVRVAPHKKVKSFECRIQSQHERK